MSSTHSPTGASGAERWLNCPGSVAASVAAELADESRPKKKKRSETYRDAGSQAHEAAAFCLNTGRLAEEAVYPRWPAYRPKDAVAVQHYLDWVLVRKALLEERYDRVELRVEILIGDPEGDFRGTVDAYLLGFEGAVAVYAEVFDYKHGSGVVVAAEENPQLMYYAHGVQKLHPSVNLFTLVVVQPRAPGYSRPDEWSIEANKLLWWATTDLFPGILATKQEDAAIKAGSWCRFCPANETCRTFLLAGGKASLPPLFIAKEAAPETIAAWTTHLANAGSDPGY